MISLQESQVFKEKLLQASHVLIVGHRNPDGDALGSVLAIADFLEENRKVYKIFCREANLQNFYFLSGLERIISDPFLISSKKFDVIVFCDCSDLKQASLGDLAEKIFGNKPFVVNIDHHATNEKYGNLNIVNEAAASATEVVMDIFKTGNIKITRDMAICLLTGILADTGNFLNPSGTAESMLHGAELLKYGFSFNRVYEYLNKNKSIDVLKFWGKILSRLIYNQELDMVIALIKKEDIEEFGLDDEACAGLSNFLNSLCEAGSIMVLRETEDLRIKGSLRTSREDVDVSKFCSLLGGGGHKRAAGFSIKGRLEETLEAWRVV